MEDSELESLKEQASELNEMDVSLQSELATVKATGAKLDIEIQELSGKRSVNSAKRARIVAERKELKSKYGEIYAKVKEEIKRRSAQENPSE